MVGNLVVFCGSLNVTGPHKLIGSGIIRRCGPVRVSMALWEEVVIVGVGL